MFYADLHIHSKYSRATSRDCDLEHLAWWAGRKGITVVGTGDFTHPAWLAEIREKLVPEENGLFRLRDDLERERLRTLPGPCRAPVHFLLSVEISTIYKKGDRTRKVHHLVYAPDLDTVERFNRKLGAIGNLASDGRPILGLDSRHLLEIALESGDGTYLIPAHIWTPWFAVLGSMSGFDAVTDCYGDLAGHVFAVETGLSSDPAMNWRVSSLDRYRLISSSDAHSPSVLGREAAVFECAPDYAAIRRALETGAGYGGTVEFFPEEGKYHLDGHRKCGIRLEPRETRARAGRCPECAKPVTVGVLSRVEDLADREQGARPAGAAPFRNLVPLPEILGEIAGVGAKSKRVSAEVAALVERLGPELQILEHLPLEELGRLSSPLVREAIARLRRGQVIREAGYDGEYGVIRMFEEHELAGPRAAGTLFEISPRTRAAAAGAVSASLEGPVFRPVDERAAALAVDSCGPSEETPLLAALDEAQRVAARCGPGPALVVAGPGTGKTRTLTHRLAYLVSAGDASPASCLAITFTQRAAEELRARLAGLLDERARAVVVTTFHGLGLQILREHRIEIGLHRGFRVASERERIELAQQLFTLPETRARRRLSEISQARRSGTAAATVQAARHVERWRAALWERDLVDFDDLIEVPLQLLESSQKVARHYRERFRWIFVDEYQDVDTLQYRLLRQLVAPAGNLFAIGDPDQAIYGFRGSNVTFFQRFREDFPAVRIFHLERNHRSSPAIVAGALQAIQPATLVPERVLTAATQPENAAPQITVHAAATERAEAEHVVSTIEVLLGGTSYFSIDSGRVEAATAAAPGAPLAFSDFAVLYRTEVQAGPIAEALARAGIPFQRRSHERLAERPGVAALLDALRVQAASAPIEAPPRAWIEQAVATALAAGDAEPKAIHSAAALLTTIAERCKGSEGWTTEAETALEIDTWDSRADGVSLLTLHAAKGLEFRVVFLVGLEDGLVPLRFGSRAGPPIDEERRLFFVGMTRARTHLILSWARRRLLRGAVKEREPSPFLSDIEARLLAASRTASRPRRLPGPTGGEQLALL